MEPLRLYLVRHAEVGERWRGRVYGDLDVELSPRGEEQTLRFAQRFATAPLDAVWSSALDRARRAAAVVATARALPHRVDAELREVHRGAWRERLWTEVEAELPGIFDRFVAAPDEHPPEGESLRQVSERARGALARLRAEHPSGHVALFAHSWIVRVLLCDALELPLTHCNRLAAETASIAIVDYHRDHAILQQMNLRDPHPL
ncbi:MAG: histidine phosphatase family protein [Planctomycetes bacterium]|nr:histidine phosphatase family protein [Planctomycetota bacterium]